MDQFDHFLNRIGKCPLLTHEEEILFARQVQAWMPLRDKELTTIAEKRTAKHGKRAYDRMFTANIKLVVFAAKKIVRMSRYLTIEDLVQEGCFGLARAIEKFDPERGYKFSTYSYWWIKQAMLRALENQDRIIRLPVNAVQFLARVKKFSLQFYAEHGRMPSYQDCVKFADVSEEYFRTYMMHAAGCSSLDAKLKASDEKLNLIDLVPSDAQIAIDALVEEDQFAELYAALNQLPESERDMLQMHYGLSGQGKMSQREIARIKRTSADSVRRREYAAYEQLRAILPTVA